MIVRGIHTVNFRGAREVRLSGLAESGVVDPELPADAGGGIVADALRFALRGGADEAARVVTDGAGFAHVEVALTVPGGARASLFRGVDRRGSCQVSLREDDGLRVTGGEDAVRARLEEFAGVPLAVWEAATFIDRPVAGVDPFRATHGPAGPPAASVPRAVPAPARSAPGATPADVSELRERAERDVDRLRRALRAETLRERMDADYAALCEFGARLRRERTETAVAADRTAAERDRVRARVRRVGEYRELVAEKRTVPVERAPKPKPVAPARRRDDAGAAALAALLLVALVHVRTSPDLGTERALGALLGLGFLAALAWYVHAAAAAGAGRRRVPPPEPARTAGDEWRDALRHRFADLGDPDDPRLLDDLRARLGPLDAEIEPLQKRLEHLDESLAAFDVEVGRAARATHGTLPPARAEAATGLAAGESAVDAVARLGKLGDAVYHAAVERDALLAVGADSAAAAADAVRVSFRALGAALGDEAGADSALSRAGLAGTDGAPASRDADVCVRLSEEAAAMGRRPPPRAPSPDAGVQVAAPREPARPDVAALLGDAVEAITGRRFVLVQDGPRLELRLQGPADATPLAWAALPLDARERIALALRLREAEAALGRGAAAEAPRCIVLMGRPTTLRDDAALAAFVATTAPRIAQVIVSAAPAPAPAAAGDSARGAVPAGAAAPAPRRVTPR